MTTSGPRVRGLSKFDWTPGGGGKAEKFSKKGELKSTSPSDPIVTAICTQITKKCGRRKEEEKDMGRMDYLWLSGQLHFMLMRRGCHTRLTYGK